MKKVVIIVLIIFCSFTTKDIKQLNFQFTVSETQLILKGLSELPFKESADLIQKIQMTANKQLTDTIKKK